jgi:hypothetical protein
LTRRIELLHKHFALPSLARDRRLAEIISDTATYPQGWTRACAIYAAGQLRLPGLAQSIRSTLAIPDHPVPETTAWALTQLDGAGGHSRDD